MQAKGFTSILTELDSDEKAGRYIKRVTEAIEISPKAGSFGGCLVRHRTKITIKAAWIQRLFGIKNTFRISESIVFINNITIKDLKNGITSEGQRI